VRRKCGCAVHVGVSLLISHACNPSALCDLLRATDGVCASRGLCASPGADAYADMGVTVPPQMWARQLVLCAVWAVQVAEYTYMQDARDRHGAVGFAPRGKVVWSRTARVGRCHAAEYGWFGSATVGRECSRTQQVRTRCSASTERGQCCDATLRIAQAGVVHITPY
jgi:hypothetical protein